MSFHPLDPKHKAIAGVTPSVYPAMARVKGGAQLPFLPNGVTPIGPTAVFHGTNQPFESFAANPRGIFFAEDRRVAESYQEIRAGTAPRVIEAVLSIGNFPGEISTGKGGG